MAQPYPADWQRQATTRDGAPYLIRPIRADDAERERDFIRGLSAESRYNRFMYEVGEPSRELIEHFVHVDYRKHMALVAVTGDGTEERIVGVARYVVDGSGSACEFAVAVADAWQSRGIGTTLTRLLFDYARAQGMKRVYGSILANNERMVGLAHWLGLKTSRSAEDATLLVTSRDL